MKSYVLLLLVSFVGCFGSENNPTFEDVLNWIEEAECCSFEPCENSIVILGETGSGKSTLANLLAGNNLEIQAFGSIHEVIRLSDPSSAVSKIEHDHFEAGTDKVIPLQLKDDVVLWDCPGFFDSENMRKQFIDTFRIHKLIENLNHVKIAVVVNGNMLTGRSQNNILDLFVRLKSIFGHDLESCTTIIITQTAPGKEQLIIDLLKKALNKQIAKYNQINIHSEARLLENDDLEKKESCELLSTLIDHDHLVFFPHPMGNDGEKISQTFHDTIINTINRSEYATLDKDNAPPLVVSEKISSTLR